MACRARNWQTAPGEKTTTHCVQIDVADLAIKSNRISEIKTLSSAKPFVRRSRLSSQLNRPPHKAQKQQTKRFCPKTLQRRNLFSPIIILPLWFLPQFFKAVSMRRKRNTRPVRGYKRDFLAGNLPWILPSPRQSPRAPCARSWSGKRCSAWSHCVIVSIWFCSSAFSFCDRGRRALDMEGERERERKLPSINLLALTTPTRFYYLWAAASGLAGRPVYHCRRGCWSASPAALVVCPPHSTFRFRVSILSIILCVVSTHAALSPRLCVSLLHLPSAIYF